MKIGIQLYSVRNRMAVDPIDTIRKVAEAGYKNIEVANHHAYEDAGVGFGITAQQTKALLEETGTHIFGAHISPLDDKTPMDKILEFHNTIGTEYIGQAIAFFSSKDDLLRQAELFNRIGEQCAKAGITYVYHNHYHEFQKFDGMTALELLMTNTDPKYVKMELDTFWARRGQQDPVEVMKKYGERIRLIHQKDFTKGYESDLELLSRVENAPIGMEEFQSVVDSATFTEIGNGILPVQDYIDAANKYCKSDYIVLEQDYSTHDEIESIKISMDSFKRFTGTEW